MMLYYVQHQDIDVQNYATRESICIYWYDNIATKKLKTYASIL